MKNRSKLVLLKLLLGLVAAQLTGCATNAMTGRSQFLLVSEKSAIAQASQAYAGMMGDLEKDGKISTDEALLQRVQGITDRLVAQAVRYRPETADWAWSVKVIDDPKTLNAFCMPGGRMAIYTGIIEKLEATDDEVAQVMGHEIAHAIANHGAEKMSVQMAANIGVVLVSAAGRSNSSRQARHDAASLAALAFINLPNSRAAETEADKLGIELAARARYDPRAAVSLWTKMTNESGSASRFDFLSTHPSGPDRIDALAALEAPMMKIYEAAQTEHQATRAWTSLSPNERVVEGSHAGDPGAASLAPEETGTPQARKPAPLVFYSAEFEAFKEGRAELTCGSECAPRFLINQGSLNGHHERQAWRELVLETLKIGYRIDLAYFYLGRGADGLGFKEAAKRYYGEAARLAESREESCANGIFVGCGGIDVKAAAVAASSGGTAAAK